MLTADSDLMVAFVGNVCLIKDKIKVLLRGNAVKGLYKLLLHNSSDSISLLPSTEITETPMSILSLHTNLLFRNPSIQSQGYVTQPLFTQPITSECFVIENSDYKSSYKLDVQQRRLGHPSLNALKVVHVIKLLALRKQNLQVFVMLVSVENHTVCIFLHLLLKLQNLLN